MSAHSASGRGLVAAALARAESWLLEPAVAPEEAVAERVSARPVVAVLGLAPGCGATVVARALAAELAARDPGGAAAVGADGVGATLALGTQAAGRLARTLSNLAGARPRPVGRLCVVEEANPPALAEAVRYLAPLVLEPGSAQAAAVALADRVVLVGSADVEPALAAVVAASLPGEAQPAIVVVNRVVERSEWAARAELALPESRVGAQLALGGRLPRGELERAIGELADLCEAS